MNTDNSTMGKYYETLFKAECLKRGLVVLQPECSHLSFDVAVFVNQRFLRIQVKGTNRLCESGGRKRYRIKFISDRGVRYHTQGVDFIAAYVEPTKTWYIIPAIMAKCYCMEINATPATESRAALTMERWDYLA